MKIREQKKKYSVVKWFDKINYTENTIRIYLNALQVYTELRIRNLNNFPKVNCRTHIFEHIHNLMYFNLLM